MLHSRLRSKTRQKRSEVLPGSSAVRRINGDMSTSVTHERPRRATATAQNYEEEQPQKRKPAKKATKKSKAPQRRSKSHQLPPSLDDDDDEYASHRPEQMDDPQRRAKTSTYHDIVRTSDDVLNKPESKKASSAPKDPAPGTTHQGKQKSATKAKERQRVELELEDVRARRQELALKKRLLDLNEDE